VRSCATNTLLGITRVNKSHDARRRKIKIKLRPPKGFPPLKRIRKNWLLRTRPLNSKP
jgi:hypothetical protein